MLKYPKVHALGKKGIEKLFDGEVEVTEKLDGSQFRVHVTEDGEVICGTRKTEGEVMDKKSFQKAIDYVENNIMNRNLATYPITLYFEFLGRRKQNVLEYDRVPKNHLYLFGAMAGEEPQPLGTESLMILANILGVEPPNVLYKGEIKELSELDKIMDVESCLGGVKAEGVVIKNYGRTFPMDLLSTSKWIGFPLMGKTIREDFKEAHVKEWKKEKPIYDRVIDTYVTQERLGKVLQKLRDEGKLEGEKKDLKYIIPEFEQDLKDEEKDDIDKALLEEAWKIIERKMKSKVVNYYIRRLERKQFGGE